MASLTQFTVVSYYRAYVERGDEPRPLTLDLLDNGSGADLIANDGIYSRYFIKYDGQDGDYTLRCQVSLSRKIL